MAKITVFNGKVLPRICVVTGGENAPLEKTGEVPCCPGWFWLMLFLPMGFAVVLVFLPMLRRKVTFTYFLSEEGDRTMQKWQARLGIAYLLGFGSVLLAFIFRDARLLVCPVVLLPFCCWFEQVYKWPFLAEECTGSSVKLSRVPSNLARVYEDEILLDRLRSGRHKSP